MIFFRGDVPGSSHWSEKAASPGSDQPGGEHLAGTAVLLKCMLLREEIQHKIQPPLAWYSVGTDVAFSAGRAFSWPVCSHHYRL